MAQDIHNVTETTTRTGDTVQKNTEVSTTQAEGDHVRNVFTRIVWFLTSALLVLLGLRFLLSLLGANTTNGVADFIYSLSQPFVAPFFSMFSYDNYSYGVSRFEVYTLVAMAFYVLLAWGVVKLATLNRD